MKFIDEELKKISNPDNVMLIKPCENYDQKMYLCAVVKEKYGCRLVALTKPRNNLTLGYFKKGLKELKSNLGKSYFNNFILQDDIRMFNKNLLEGFGSYDIEDKPETLLVFASFENAINIIFLEENKHNYNNITKNNLNKLLTKNDIEIKNNDELQKCTAYIRLLDNYSNEQTLTLEFEL